MRIEVVSDMPDAVYHSDPCEIPSLSASIASKLINQCPAKAVIRHPKALDLSGGRYEYRPMKSTDEMRKGDLIHAYLLDPKTLGERYVELPFDSWRTKASKEAKKAALDAGKEPLKEGELQKLATECRYVMDAISSSGIQLIGPSTEREMAAFWTEQTEFGEIQCRGKLDLYEDGLITDLKTCSSAHPKAVTKHILSFGYDLQAAAYIRAIEANYPELQGKVNYRWVFVEQEFPHCVTGVVMAGTMKRLGEEKWRKACNLWARCVEEQRWPFYSEEAVVAEPPMWALEEMYGLEEERVNGGDDE